MKKEQRKSEKKAKKSFIKAQTNFRCGSSRSDKIEAFKKGFLRKD